MRRHPCLLQAWFTSWLWATSAESSGLPAYALPLLLGGEREEGLCSLHCASCPGETKSLLGQLTLHLSRD